MSNSDTAYRRVQDLSARIKQLEETLTGNGKLPMSEIPKMQAELSKLKKEQDLLERRTR